ncbi:MAG: excinuclease ABC subunit UvrC [Leptospiraceae bacterium]|nr:excinuclease ABC subunit UvrC [Leptospiraceae bacterium]MCK6380566.1 excinuclease ABC subunit UvrC [Leptospiraceae bacterium]NUM40737.1 excinuclease ABC subunit UvrC [Leptospiraceae bacterium]
MSFLFEENIVLKEKIKNLKNSSGCYLWKNKNSEIIYVGKATDISSRVRSYLNPNQSDLKTRYLQSEIYDLDWILTNSEVEALILEANLIKKYNPRFNVRLKDDKKYPYICVSTDEEFPMVYLTRNVKDDKKKYFGPFTDVKGARDLLSVIHKFFPIRKTYQKLPAKPKRPCINFQMGRCLAPCTGKVTQDEYWVIVNQVLKFLEGKKEDLIKELKLKMGNHSKNLEYEAAKRYRDIIQNVSLYQKKQLVVSIDGGDEDIFAFARRDDDGQAVIFEVREGKLESKKTFALQGLEYSTQREVISSFLRDYYVNAKFIPRTIFLPENIKDEANVLLEHIAKITGFSVKIKFPSKGEKASLIRLAERNAELNLTERILALKYKDQSSALKELKEILKLGDTPNIIECYDISHFQGSEPVASGVMFLEGKPFKTGYRNYRIKSHKGINDPAMIHEVIARRLQKLLNEGESIPDLIVIDGGLTQLTRACEAALALDLKNLPIIGLAKKREEIYFPGEKTPYQFDKNSPAMRLLRHIRDETHRFGVKFHRSRRNKETLKSILSEISDIGIERRKSISAYFAGKKKIQDASKNELMEIPGIGEKLANSIYEKIQTLSRKN